jgi:DNA-binding MarR family transcriptional regulator
VLAEVAKIDRMTASQSLQSLEQKGYITRNASPGDRRANRVLLTTKGRRVALEAIKRLAATHTAFFSPLAGETEAVVSYLQQLIRANELP